jgi:hypothetical protein
MLCEDLLMHYALSTFKKNYGEGSDALLLPVRYFYLCLIFTCAVLFIVDIQTLCEKLLVQ